MKWKESPAIFWLFAAFTLEKGYQCKDDRNSWNADVDEFHEAVLDGVILGEPDVRAIFRSPRPYDVFLGFWQNLQKFVTLAKVHFNGVSGNHIGARYTFIHDFLHIYVSHSRNSLARYHNLYRNSICPVFSVMSPMVYVLLPCATDCLPVIVPSLLFRFVPIE